MGDASGSRELMACSGCDDIDEVERSSRTEGIGGGRGASGERFSEGAADPVPRPG